MSQDISKSLMLLDVNVPGLTSTSDDTNNDTGNGNDTNNLTVNDKDDDDSDSDQIKDKKIITKITMTQSKVLTNLNNNTNKLILNYSNNLKLKLNDKIKVRFQSIGSIKQLNPNIFKISKNQKFLTIIKFLEKKLSIATTTNNNHDSNKQLNHFTNGFIFCYIKNSISPSPDENLSNLFDLFNTNGELIINYCNKIAFG
ncbi:unnamed protein product [[Candida] boidinii]|nr:hypothetical protein B5S30_g4466 [[Candida] boidinii]OWB86003.1 hypothetical protein B5S33_g4681 [[Candida] boidinii]GMF25117.1 unnamed protein product [[Candida] boidinii]